MLLAAQFPFRKIVGVELSERLCGVARQNVSSASIPNQECRRFEVICLDATEYDLPDEPLVIYLFNPFRGPLMQRFVSNLERSLHRAPRKVYLLYWCPFEETVIARSPYFHKIEGKCELYSIYGST
jgi:hypothetical protein